MNKVRILQPDERADYLIGGLFGSRRFFCSNCKGDLWLEPSGVERIRLCPDTKLLCFECGLKYIAETNPHISIPSPSAAVNDLGGDADLLAEVFQNIDSRLDEALRSRGLKKI